MDGISIYSIIYQPRQTLRFMRDVFRFILQRTLNSRLSGKYAKNRKIDRLRDKSYSELAVNKCILCKYSYKTISYLVTPESVLLAHLAMRLIYDHL